MQWLIYIKNIFVFNWFILQVTIKFILNTYFYTFIQSNLVVFTPGIVIIKKLTLTSIYLMFKIFLLDFSVS